MFARLRLRYYLWRFIASKSFKTSLFYANKFIKLNRKIKMKEREHFADPLDIASQTEAAAVNLGIQSARIKAMKPEFEAIGACLNCGEHLDDGIRFCDSYCRDDFVKRTRNR